MVGYRKREKSKEKKHYELIDSVPENILSAENFCGFALHLSLQMCVNMVADLMQ
jgi:hypothetical protein